MVVPSTSAASRSAAQRRPLALVLLLAPACLLALVTAAGCASEPSLQRAVTVVEGRRTTVRLVKFDPSRTMIFTLQNASSGSAEEVYSDPTGNDQTKVVDDGQLQRLLDIFAEKGLFAGAGTGLPAAARSAILVEQDGRRWALHGTTAEAARKMAFTEAQAYFLSAYNGATAYHSSEVHRGDFEAERNRTLPGSGGRKQ